MSVYESTCFRHHFAYLQVTGLYYTSLASTATGTIFSVNHTFHQFGNRLFVILKKKKKKKKRKMEYRFLGRSGLQVSAISLGSWLTYGGHVDKGTLSLYSTIAHSVWRIHFDHY